MNIVNIQLKRKEGFSYYKNSHRRYDLTLKVSNMNKGQVQILETAIQRVCVEILPERDVTPYGESIKQMTQTPAEANKKEEDALVERMLKSTTPKKQKGGKKKKDVK